jgi:hypothetical protein
MAPLKAPLKAPLMARVKAPLIARVKAPLIPSCVYSHDRNVYHNQKIMAYVYIILFALLSTVEAVFPNYNPALGALDTPNRDELVEKYFHLGLKAVEILGFLTNVHGFTLSLRQLKRILRARGCRRRKAPSDFDEVVRIIEVELRGSSSLLGYRALHQRLTNDYGLIVTRSVVRRILKVVDPEGVQARSRHRLRRRQYCAKGPNYLWHIDGYDKLKPFGFCIHGAIDGYSRRILWLEVASSNNNPEIIAHFFSKNVHLLGGTASIIRADRGTENVNVAAIQRFFRRLQIDEFSGGKSFLYGRSTANQRIEAWWGILRKSCTDWWIRYFKDLRDTGVYQDDDIFHRQCLKFCYMDVIQKELHKTARHWNLHRIRPSTNAESPPGRPDVLYFNPEAMDTRDYLIPVNQEDLDIATEMYSRPPEEQGCLPEFNELINLIMQDEGLRMPNNADEAKNLYTALLEHIDELDHPM